MHKCMKSWLRDKKYFLYFITNNKGENNETIRKTERCDNRC